MRAFAAEEELGSVAAECASPACRVELVRFGTIKNILDMTAGERDYGGRGVHLVASWQVLTAML